MAGDKRSQAKQILEASSIGWMFPLAIGIGFLWGRWLDGIFHTAPWLTGIFAVFGVIAAFINLFRMAKSDDTGGTPPDDAGSA
jgi:F0F1-type ATP synthase assembly protein I